VFVGSGFGFFVLGFLEFLPRAFAWTSVSGLVSHKESLALELFKENEASPEQSHFCACFFLMAANFPLPIPFVHPLDVFLNRIYKTLPT
jgi:glycopeptide antibiotics resistance protein